MLAMLFLACSVDLSGGTTETVNTRVAGVIFNPDSTYAINSRVRLVPSDQNPLLPDPEIHTAITDDSGYYQFEVTTESRYYNLLATLENHSLFIDSLLLEPENRIDVEPCTLKPHSSVSGRVRLQNDSIPDTVYVAIMGTDLYGVFESGQFLLPNIPRGDFQLRIFSSDQDFYLKDTGIQIDDSTVHVLEDTLILPPRIFLLDDFEDGNILLYNNRSDIGTGHNSYWYTFNERSDTNNTLVEPDLSTGESISEAFSTSDAYEGRSMHITFVLAQREVAFGGVGCTIGPEGGYVDLRKMSAVSFFIKGKGTISVSFDSKVNDRYPEEDRWGRWGKTIDIPQEWTRIEVKATELLPQAYSPQERDSLSWDSVCDSVRTLHFTTSASAGDTVNVQIDNIYLHGIVKEELAAE